MDFNTFWGYLINYCLSLNTLEKRKTIKTNLKKKAETWEFLPFNPGWSQHLAVGLGAKRYTVSNRHDLHLRLRRMRAWVDLRHRKYIDATLLFPHVRLTAISLALHARTQSDARWYIIIAVNFSNFFIQGKPQFNADGYLIFAKRDQTKIKFWMIQPRLKSRSVNMQSVPPPLIAKPSGARQRHVS